MCHHYMTNTCNQQAPALSEQQQLGQQVIGVHRVQGNVDANVARQNELLVIINKNTSAYRQAFGFREWRQACEVSSHQGVQEFRV